MTTPAPAPKTVEQLLREARASLPFRLSPAEAAQAQAAGALLIDMRGDDQRRRDGLIPGALVIPRNSLEWRCDPKSAWHDPVIRSHEQRLVLVCDEGFSSSLAAAALQQLGMHLACDVEGGFQAWRHAGLPVTPARSDDADPNPEDGATSPALHWDAAYRRGGAEAVSWYQREPTMAVALIDELGVTPDAAVLDVGGGASALAATLVRRGFQDVTVLDFSQDALDSCRRRLGALAAQVHLLCADLLTMQPSRRYRLWHDRALLHFFVEPEQRARYVRTLGAALERDGVVLLGVFAEDGPERCSGLPVLRYSAGRLSSLLGEEFELVAERQERHVTPGGAEQPFQWAAFKRAGQ